MRILVVDDDEDIIELLKYNLEKQSFIVRTLVNSKKAVFVACDFSPDLIILDIGSNIPVTPGGNIPTYRHVPSPIF